MKNIFLAFAFLMVCITENLHAETIRRDYYEIISDEFSESVKPGTCKVTGLVKSVDEVLISGGTIANLGRSRSTTTKTDGTYDLVLTAKDTAIFFYHPDFGEIVLWNYPFKSQHHVVINFYTREKSDVPVVDEKPVIYIYSHEQREVTLSVHPQEMSFTYPAADENNEWIILTQADGTFMNTKDNKSYPYLFWEGLSYELNYYINSQNQTVGNLISTDTLVSFFENTLTCLGLNAREQTDFITYWGPKIVTREYAFIQFLTDEEVDEHIGVLKVEPQPHTLRRIYMLYTPLDNMNNFTNFIPQTFLPFTRKGFTVIEWGGSCMPQNKLL
ncbi:MAG: hypothetical protein IPH66_08030 [Crocinitomicaceae bacterium]|nr:hypothetical protein [Crocinitomicaceae bacterium]